jgi:hypothetical protein
MSGLATRNGNGLALASGSPLPEAIEAAIAEGNLDKLSSEQRVIWYQHRCQAAGLNPASRPFEYIRLQGKLTLYATKACTDQLSGMHGLSHKIIGKETIDGIHTVTVEVSSISGRTTQDIGAVHIGGLKGDLLANAYMKALTKAKRRGTLSLCGLGDVIDESELETVQDVRECTPTGQPKPLENNSGFGKGMYASPEQTEVFLRRMDEYLAKRNAKWLDRWMSNGEVPNGIKDLCSRWQADNHLVKWAVTTGRLAPMDVELGQKARQVGRFTAIIYHRSKEEQKAITQELQRYVDEQERLALDRLQRENPDLFEPSPDEEEEADAFSDLTADNFIDVEAEEEPGSDG